MTFQIHFQKESLLTPQKNPFLVPTEKLKTLVEAEIEVLGAWPTPLRHKTLTPLALAACDRGKTMREDIIASLLETLILDHLLLWEPEPEGLVKLQAEIWQPLITRFNKRMKTHLRSVMTLDPIELPPESRGEINAYLQNLNAFELTGISHLSHLTHSLILPLLAYQDRMSSEYVMKASELHESFQSIQWGEEPSAKERSNAIGREIGETLEFLDAARL